MIGVGLMILGLVFRIIIEIISIHKAKEINNLDATLKIVKNNRKYDYVLSI